MLSNLSARLLVMTILFVMLAEIFIFAPSVARYRQDYLTDKIAAAELALYAIDAAPDGMVSDQLRADLLNKTNIYSVAVRKLGARKALMVNMPPDVHQTYDLRVRDVPMLMVDAFTLLFRTEARIIRVLAKSSRDPLAELDIVMDEVPLRDAIIDFSWRIFWLSILISLFTASLVFLSLNWLIVRPVKRLTESMITFKKDPENGENIIDPSKRSDEIGVAEHELSEMQTELRQALRQKKHLAALGTAVAKVNHDLRGILSTALLVSDRLEASEDPEVKKVTPALFSAIDRAVDLCGKTLKYVGQDQPPIHKTNFPLASILQEAAQGLPQDTIVQVEFSEHLRIFADSNQIFRVFNNLFRNASHAGASELTVKAHSKDGEIQVFVEDNGPGLPPKARDNLFQPFEGSARIGGTGLGLAIAKELMEAHGGSLSLEKSDGFGTVFRLSFCDQSED